MTSTERKGWTCPACERWFARRNQQHVCERWRVEDHIGPASDRARALYERFLDRLRECGPFDQVAVRTYIGFRGPQRVFAGVYFSGDRLMGYLDLPRKVTSPRFRSVSDYTKSLWVHGFVITSESELDDEFAGWMAEAYAIGQARPGSRKSR